jgi:hypothetical protein
MGLSTAIKYLRCTTSAAAGSGLGTALKYLLGAAGIGLGTTIKYLRRAARLRPGHRDQVPTTHSERRREQLPWNFDQGPVAHNERRRGQRPEPVPGITDAPVVVVVVVRRVLPRASVKKLK